MGTQVGVARLNVTLGVDKDCDVKTGDTDGIDGTVDVRVSISVTTGSQ